MTSKNDFGLGRELLITKSRVRSIFTPHKPIQSKDLFFGRTREVQKLIENINTPGQHALLYGDRGVGKSSLANITAELINIIIDGKLYVKRCDSSDGFTSIMAKPLNDLGYDIDVTALQKKTKSSGKATASVVLIKSEMSSEDEKVETIDGPNIKSLSPAWVAERLEKVKGLLVIDEADAIRKKEDRKKIAELIKHLSDLGSSFKVLIVGIAETGEQLTAGHPSVQRCLKETKLARMSPDELREIIVGGSRQLRITFEYDVIKSIVDLSAGYPHFTHLLALKCAEEAIAESKSVIKISDLDKAMGIAGEDAEVTLKKMFDDAVRSTQTDMYRFILAAASQCFGHEFSASELRSKLKNVYKIDIKQGGLNNYLKKLISDEDRTILRRIAKGVYRFSDPRMPSYVKIVTRNLQRQD